MRFKIDWASLILGRKFTVFLCFTLYLRAISQVQAPGGGGGTWRGDITGRYKFGGAYIWRGLFSEFYGIWRTGLSDSETAKNPELCCAPCIRRKQIFVILHHC